MKIATWNVNSLRVRLKQVCQWLSNNTADILCLQETKLPDDIFPAEEIREAGFYALFAGQKTYNGVAILSRTPGENAIRNNPFFPDSQQRLLAATYGQLRVISAYIPNGAAVGSEKYTYKLAWLNALCQFLAEERKKYPYVVLAGDYNIAPTDADVHDPDAWAGHILVSEPERHAFQALLNTGFKDAFRLFNQPEKSFSWWDYRQLAFQRNRGLRIDHILLSHELAPYCTRCTIDRTPRKWQQPSDHTPVIAELALQPH